MNLFAMVFLLIGSHQVAEPAAWTDTITSEKIAVRVEKVLYELPGHATFFIHTLHRWSKRMGRKAQS
jgi:hypothetical protein